MGAEKPLNDGKNQSEDREDNAYPEIAETEPTPELERYPAVSKDDGVEVPPPRPGDPNGPDSTAPDQR